MIKHDKTHLLVSKFVIVCPNGLSSNVGWLFEGASFFSENIGCMERSSGWFVFIMVGTQIFIKQVAADSKHEIFDV